MTEHAGSLWTKSSFSQSQGCVEWTVADDGRSICVRNSKDPGGSVLVFTSAEWAAFVAGVKRGEADLPEPRSVI